MSTVIGGYWNTCVPIPTLVKSTVFDLVTSVVTVPPTPTSIKRKRLSSILRIEYLLSTSRPVIAVPVVE